MNSALYEFSGKDRKEFSITPLGAAIVEALPDQSRKRQIQRTFKRQHKCPVSAIFPTARDVESWYRERGQRVRAISGEEPTP